MADVHIGPGAVNYDAAAHNPGDTIFLDAGAYTQLYIRNAVGTLADPITIINSGGQVVVNTAEVIGLYLTTSEHVHCTGTGSADPYGILIQTSAWAGVSIRQVSYIEFDHVHVDGVPGIGIQSKPSTADQYDTLIHDCKINDVGREGIYIGDSNFSTSGLGCYDTVIYNCDLDVIAWDGIQVCGAPSGINVYYNSVVDAGNAASVPGNSQAGLIIDSYCDGGTWYGNWIEDCYRGIYIHATVTDSPEIYQNVIIDSNNIAILGFGGDATKIYNNTIVHSAGEGINIGAWLSNVVIVNNIVLETIGASITSGGTENHNDTKEEGYAEATYGFVNFAADDYHLTPPCDGIDAGIDMGLPYQGTAPDLGAYEYETIPPSVTVHAAAALAVDSPCKRIGGRRQ